MKITTTTTAVAAVLLTLTACGDAGPTPDTNPVEAPEVTAALDWIEAAGMEFGAAPYSPPGWPYRIGDKIDHETRKQLHKRLPDFHAVEAVTWVDGRAFGAIYDEPAEIYLGHFPKKIRRSDYEALQRLGIAKLPPYGGSLDHVLGDRFEAAGGAVLDSLDVLRARWHEPFRSRQRSGRDGKP